MRVDKPHLLHARLPPKHNALVYFIGKFEVNQSVVLRWGRREGKCRLSAACLLSSVMVAKINFKSLVAKVSVIGKLSALFEVNQSVVLRWGRRKRRLGSACLLSSVMRASRLVARAERCRLAALRLSSLSTVTLRLFEYLNL